MIQQQHYRPELPETWRNVENIPDKEEKPPQLQERITESRCGSDAGNYCIDDEDKNTVVNPDGNRGNPNMTIINESGLYSNYPAKRPHIWASERGASRKASSFRFCNQLHIFYFFNTKAPPQQRKIKGSSKILHP